MSKTGKNHGGHIPGENILHQNCRPSAAVLRLQEDCNPLPNLQRDRPKSGRLPSLPSPATSKYRESGTWLTTKQYECHPRCSLCGGNHQRQPISAVTDFCPPSTAGNRSRPRGELVPRPRNHVASAQRPASRGPRREGCLGRSSSRPDGTRSLLRQEQFQAPFQFQSQDLIATTDVIPWQDLEARSFLKCQKRKQRSSAGHAAASCRFLAVQSPEPSDAPVENVVVDRRNRSKLPDKLVDYRFIYPEFLPDRDFSLRNSIREKLERKDMLNRRSVIEIPEFYVGSIMAVTVSDNNAPGKQNRFVGICIMRAGIGMRHRFTLRNVIDNQGVEIMYDLYCPLLLKIEVLRLEKRLDEHLRYLRDAPLEYSTFPFDMEPQTHSEGAAVPINTLKVKLKPRPWLERWERQNLKGVQDLGLPQKFYDKAAAVATPWERYDLMKQYREVITEEDQLPIWEQVEHHRETVEDVQKRERRRTLLQKPKT
ncbi:large ribosomal subunit protein bL19m isoform X3 [Dermacentor albipictus]|uniref:large ribosomal subunit protein bL19m isoform X3 n=1 Tax=Dermacentor albipictus TaxID=60249 RepID=UPI0031FD446C